MAALLVTRKHVSRSEGPDEMTPLSWAGVLLPVAGGFACGISLIVKPEIWASNLFDKFSRFRQPWAAPRLRALGVWVVVMMSAACIVLVVLVSRGLL